MTSGGEFALKPTIRDSKTKVTQELLDNYLRPGLTKITFCYWNHPWIMSFTKFSQMRCPHMTSGREFALKPTIRESKTKDAQELLDNNLFPSMTKITFCYSNHPWIMSFIEFSKIWSPYMTSGREFALKPTIRDSKTKSPKNTSISTSSLAWPK